MDVPLRAVAALSPPAGAATTQTSAQLHAEPLHEQRPVDALVADADTFIIRVRPLNVHADLLRRPQVGEEPLGLAPQGSVISNLRYSRPYHALYSAHISVPGERQKGDLTGPHLARALCAPDRRKRKFSEQSNSSATSTKVRPSRSR